MVVNLGNYSCPRHHGPTAAMEAWFPWAGHRLCECSSLWWEGKADLCVALTGWLGVLRSPLRAGVMSLLLIFILLVYLSLHPFFLKQNLLHVCGHMWTSEDDLLGQVSPLPPLCGSGARTQVVRFAGPKLTCWASCSAPCPCWAGWSAPCLHSFFTHST